MKKTEILHTSHKMRERKREREEREKGKESN
jgi:hypothetical protein